MPAKKRKPAGPPSPAATAWLTSAQNELCHTYRHWEDRWPRLLQWKKAKAREVEWWDIAAAKCLELGVPAPLMVYMCYAHANARPEEAEVPFSANTLRSEHLIHRSAANFRARMGTTLKACEPLYILRHRKELVQPGTLLATARLTAELVCEYYDTLMEVKSFEVTRGKTALNDSAWDTLAYHVCQENPFVLLHLARTAKVRALAAANAFLLCDSQPWHTQIWEGICSPNSLNNLEQLAGGPVREYFTGGLIRTAWPSVVLQERPYSQLDDEIDPPGLRLATMWPCALTTNYLAAKLDRARSGEGLP